MEQKRFTPGPKMTALLEGGQHKLAEYQLQWTSIKQPVILRLQGLLLCDLQRSLSLQQHQRRSFPDGITSLRFHSLDLLRYMGICFKPTLFAEPELLFHTVDFSRAVFSVLGLVCHEFPLPSAGETWF